MREVVAYALIFLLFVYCYKQNNKREERYIGLINRLSEALGSIVDFRQDTKKYK